MPEELVSPSQVRRRQLGCERVNWSVMLFFQDQLFLWNRSSRRK